MLIEVLKSELVFTFMRDIIATRTLPPLFVPFGNIFPSWAHKVIVQEIIKRGTTVAQWLGCCATNWKVAGSIPDDVIGIFH